MRPRPAAAAAALALAPFAAEGQTSMQVLTSYTISGCAEGPLRYDLATARYVEGRPVCFGGFTTLTVEPAAFVPNRLDFRTAGTLTAMLDPALRAPFVFITGSDARIVSAGCPSGCQAGGFPFVGMSTLLPGTPASLRVDGFAGSLAPADLGSFQSLRAAVFLEYSLPDDDDALFSRRVDLVLTAVPEPSTAALSLGGVLALAAVRRRRGPRA